MFVIINGPLGIGKTETAWELLGLFDKAIMMDGDYLGAVQPFSIADEQRVDYLYQTLRHTAAWHFQHGYRNFVINYVFEEAESASSLRRMLAEIDPEIYTFRLVCADAEIERRIHNRSSDPERVDWELIRYKQLVEIQNRNAAYGDLGYVLDTTHLTARQAAQRIWENLHETVEIVPYDPAWAEIFTQERARIAQALASQEPCIEHIGSTSVSGLAAKPIIDILVSIPSLENAWRCIAPLAELGYTFVDYPENVERRFFRRGFPRTHHIHIVQSGGREEREKLAFRDALRADPDLQQRYQALKQALAAVHPNDRARYAQEKTDFVRQILAARFS